MSWIAESWATIPTHMRVVSAVGPLIGLPAAGQLAASLGYAPLVGVAVAVPTFLAAGLIGLWVRHARTQLHDGG